VAAKLAATKAKEVAEENPAAAGVGLLIMGGVLIWGIGKIPNPFALPGKAADAVVEAAKVAAEAVKDAALFTIDVSEDIVTLQGIGALGDVGDAIDNNVNIIPETREFFAGLWSGLENEYSTAWKGDAVQGFSLTTGGAYWSQPFGPNPLPPPGPAREFGVKVGGVLDTVDRYTVDPVINLLRRGIPWL